MPKRPKVITQEQLIAAAEHLSTSREQFINELRMIMESFVAFQERSVPSVIISMHGIATSMPVSNYNLSSLNRSSAWWTC